MCPVSESLTFSHSIRLLRVRKWLCKPFLLPSNPSLSRRWIGLCSAMPIATKSRSRGGATLLFPRLLYCSVSAARLHRILRQALSGSSDLVQSFRDTITYTILSVYVTQRGPYSFGPITRACSSGKYYPKDRHPRMARTIISVMETYRRPPKAERRGNRLYKPRGVSRQTANIFLLKTPAQ